MATNEVTQILERLDGGRLWLKGDMGEWRDPAGEVCIMGAVCAVHQRELCMTPEEITAVILEQFPERIVDAHDEPAYQNTVAAFNDHPDTRWPDVQLVLEKAAVLYDERLPL